MDAGSKRLGVDVSVVFGYPVGPGLPLVRINLHACVPVPVRQREWWRVCLFGDGDTLLRVCGRCPQKRSDDVDITLNCTMKELALGTVVPFNWTREVGHRDGSP